MKNDEIKKMLKNIKARIAEAEKIIRVANLEIELIQKLCEHSDRESWTNDDGNGQFKVERCRVCDLQKDGGLD